jgi:hypothetical protein
MRFLYLNPKDHVNPFNVSILLWQLEILLNNEYPLKQNRRRRSNAGKQQSKQ